MNKDKRLLGKGKARDFMHDVAKGEVLIEQGDDVYAVQEASFFCPVCDGCGCRSCRFTGENRRPEVIR